MNHITTVKIDDFEHYKEYVQNRQFLINTDLILDLKHNYYLLFIFSKFTTTFEVLDNRSKINNFYNETKNNLMISFDLINLNYLNSAKQIMRSSIESFFRLVLSIARYIEYRENKKKGIFNATETLKNLKSMADTHSIWKMNQYVVSFFIDKPVYKTFENLYEKYGELSGNVHVNKKENFTPKST